MCPAGRDCSARTRRAHFQLNFKPNTRDEEGTEGCAKDLLGFVVLKNSRNDFLAFRCIFVPQLSEAVLADSEGLMLVVGKNQVVLAAAEISHVLINDSTLQPMYCILLVLSQRKASLPQPIRYFPFPSQIYSISAGFFVREAPLRLSLQPVRCLLEWEMMESRLRLCLRSLMGVY